MKKKLLYLRTDIIDKELVAGGSVTHTTGVIQGFSSLGYDIFCASSAMLKTLQTLNISKLYKLKNPAFLKILRWKINCLLSNIFFTLTILQVIKKHNPEVLYQRYSVLNCSGIIASKMKKIPLVLEYNGSEAWVNKHWAKKRLFNFNWLISSIEKINIKHADHIVVVSNALKQELIDRGISAEKILVNPNGVNTDVYHPGKLIKERDEIRNNLKINEKFVFGFIGTFSQWHGIEFLGKIMPTIIKQQPNCHFLLIGDGPLLAGLKDEIKKAGIEKQVSFPGIVPAQQAKKYLASCDAFLSPNQPNPDGSRFFGSPTKLFEYMSFAKPIIATDFEQLTEIINPAVRTFELNCKIDNNQIGILVPPQDKKKFIHAACSLMQWDKKILKQIGNNARKKVMNNYSWLEHVKKIEHFTGLKKELNESTQ